MARSKVKGPLRAKTLEAWQSRPGPRIEPRGARFPSVARRNPVDLSAPRRGEGRSVGAAPRLTLTVPGGWDGDGFAHPWSLPVQALRSPKRRGVHRGEFHLTGHHMSPSLDPSAGTAQEQHHPCEGDHRCQGQPAKVSAAARRPF